MKFRKWQLVYDNQLNKWGVVVMTTKYEVRINYSNKGYHPIVYKLNEIQYSTRFENWSKLS